MADYESRDLATAARRAQETMAGDDDRPGRAELADYVSVRTLEREVRDARREAIAEVVEAVREETAFYEDCVAGSEDKRAGYALGFYEAADFIEQRFAWTPGRGRDEAAGW